MSRKATEMPAPQTPAMEVLFLEGKPRDEALEAEMASPEEFAQQETQAETPLAVLLEEPEEFAVETPSTAREIPAEIKAFVDKGYALWQAKPRKWWAKNVPDEAVMRKVKRDAKAYAQSQGLVFRVKTTTEKTLLVYRVTPKAQNESAASNAADGSHADLN